MSTLFLVGTSLGNLEDVTIRSLRAVFESKFVLAEDTRVFSSYKGLLKNKYLNSFNSLGITSNNDQKINSYRDQTHPKMIKSILQILDNGDDIYLFSDSGMPAISDPGWKLIEEAIQNGHSVDVVPGPTALISGLLLSGLTTDRFSFLGFLPRTEGKAKRLIEKYLNGENTVILYESPFRVIKTLKLISKHFPGANVSAVGEITKKFQRVERGSADDLIKAFEARAPKGEWVVCLR